MTLASATSTSIQPNRLTYDPNGSPVSFTATVVNVSDIFATFRLEVIAAGAEAEGRQWYRLTPAIGAKVPPGDRAEFTVEIVQPPVRHFAGDIDLTVRIVALELGLEERQLVRLSLAGSATLPLQLEVTAPAIQVSPGGMADLSVRVTNPNPQALAIGVQCRGLSPDWLPDGTIQRIKISRGQFIDVSFPCHIPAAATTRSQTYPFSFALIDAPGEATASGTLEVLPMGEVGLECEWPCQRLQPPEQPSHEDMAEAVFELDVSNDSNLPQVVSIAARYQSRSHRRRPPTAPPVTMTPSNLDLAEGESGMVTLLAPHRRPWWGWTRRYHLDVSGSLSDNRIPLQPETLPLEVRVSPMIPLLVQLAGALALLAFAAILPGLLKPTHHTAPVRTVRFNGAATELVSGSDDRSIRRWQIRGNRLVAQGIVAEVDEAVRVVRYRPVRNNWLAAGYENGSMQLLNLVSGRNLEMFAPQIDGGDRRDDRVFALAFEPDSRLLFSGHGSGRIFSWQLRLGAEDAQLVNRAPQLVDRAGFAIESMMFAGGSRRFLAVAGQFNRLALWDFQSGEFIPVPYERAGNSSVITSVTVADSRPNVLAVSDSRGQISLWDLSTCLTVGDCPLQETDGWPGHGGLPVRSLAMSEDGCFLASGGDDGRVVLWSLVRANGTNGLRQDSARVLRRSRQGINSVDIVRLQDRLLVASGGNDRRVQLHSVPLEEGSNGSCSSP